MWWPQVRAHHGEPHAYPRRLAQTPRRGATPGAAPLTARPVAGDRDDLVSSAAHNGLMDVDAFIRDGYVVIRGAFGADTAAACRAAIWDCMAGQGIREDDPATWPPLAELDDLARRAVRRRGHVPGPCRCLRRADRARPVDLTGQCRRRGGGAVPL